MLKCAARTIVLLIAAISISFPSQSFEVKLDSEQLKEFKCLAYNLHYEARGEKGSGMIAVANVVMNRVESGLFPDSVCDVVFQKTFVKSTQKTVCQFSWVCTHKNYRKEQISQTARFVAYEAIVNKSLKDKTNGALFFHSTNIKYPGWKNMKRTASIGRHVFYTHSRIPNGHFKTEARAGETQRGG